MQLRLPAVSRKQCRGPSGRGRARLRSEDSTSLFLSFGVPPGRPLLQGIEPSRLPNLPPLERRTTRGPWGPSSPGLVTRVSWWGGWVIANRVTSVSPKPHGRRQEWGSAQVVSLKIRLQGVPGARREA